ncbi:hypothetical protein SESBI_11993 [Sesbania bispinosa]|nr:hypothetical protein SESBI_11993 [Sesbania bispinosa]
MPLRTRIPTRREASGEVASQPRDPLQRGRGRGCSRCRRSVNAGKNGSAAGVANAEVDQQANAMAGGIEVTLAEFMKLKPPTFSGSNANEDPQRFIDGLERLWRALGCSYIRVVELASFQLEGVTYDLFDTVTRGRLVGSPLLAWGEFSRLFMARFLLESVKDGLAHEFEQLEQTEEEICVKRFIGGLRVYIFRSMKEKGGSGRDSRKKQRVEGSQSSHPNVGVGSVPGYQVQQRAVSQRGGSSGQSFGTAQSHRSDLGRSSQTTFIQWHFGCSQTGHIRRDCLVALTQPISSHASAPAALASSQAPFAPVRQFGGSSGRGSGVA